MRFNTLFFLLSLSCLYFALAQVSYEDCCLKYVKGHRQAKHAVAYRRQETDGGCNIPAIVMTLKKGRVICADPNASWVKKVITSIDNKKQAPEKPIRKPVPQNKRG